MAPVMKELKLSSGFDMPTVGLGTWTIFNNPEGEMAKVIKEAIKVGYRHIDTAQVYGTEPLIGLALAPLLESGEVNREELFITTKVWSTNHRPEDVKSSVQKSLQDLKLDYIDLLLIHWPMAYQSGGEHFPKGEDGFLLCTSDDYLDTWKALEELVEAGKVRSIGLSNFSIKQIQRVLDNCKIKPCNHQVELNAYLNNKEVADFCLKNDITVTCYAPFGNPGRTWVNEGEPSLFEEPVVKALAERFGKKTSQVLLRFLLQKGYIVIPKTVTESRLAENIAVMDFELSDNDMANLDKLNRDLRVYAEPIGAKSEFYPF